MIIEIKNPTIIVDGHHRMRALNLVFTQWENFMCTVCKHAFDAVTYTDTRGHCPLCNQDKTIPLEIKND